MRERGRSKWEVVGLTEKRGQLGEINEKKRRGEKGKMKKAETRMMKSISYGRHE